MARNTTTYDEIRALSLSELRGAWAGVVKKGDTFTVNGKSVTVLWNTPKTIRLKIDGITTVTIKRHPPNGKNLDSNAKGIRFMRSIADEICMDLLQQHNPFRTPSDSYTIIETAIIQSSEADIM